MKLSFKLNTESINNLIKSLKLIDDKIDKITELALKDLAERGITYIKEYLSIYGLGNSAIADNLQLVKTENGYQLIATGKQLGGGLCQAVLVEFGTGIVGSENPHALAGENNYAYDINNHSYSGRWYPTDENDKNSTKYVTKGGSILAHTKGMQSRPFMYSTQAKLETEMAEVLRKYLKAVI